MLKIGLLLLLSFTQNQPQITQDSSGLKDLIREQQIENQLLEKEVELLEEHVKEIRSTVYWALGGVFTLALLFVGVNWFTTNNLYEKDKDILVQKFQMNLRNEIESLNNKLSEKISDVESRLRKEHLEKFELLLYSAKKIAEANRLTLLGQVQQSMEKDDIKEALQKMEIILIQNMHINDWTNLEADIRMIEIILKPHSKLDEKFVQSFKDTLDLILEYDRRFVDRIDQIKRDLE